MGGWCNYGITNVIEYDNLLEKGAGNVSIVHGQLSEARAKVDMPIYLMWS